MDKIDIQFEQDLNEEHEVESSEAVFIQGVECWLNKETWSFRVWLKGVGNIGTGSNKYDAVKQANEYFNRLFRKEVI